MSWTYATPRSVCVVFPTTFLQHSVKPQHELGVALLSLLWPVDASSTIHTAYFLHMQNITSAGRSSNSSVLKHVQRTLICQPCTSPCLIKIPESELCVLTRPQVACLCTHLNPTEHIHALTSRGTAAPHARGGGLFRILNLSFGMQGGDIVMLRWFIAQPAGCL